MTNKLVFTQAAVSQNVRQLEERLGPLVIANKRDDQYGGDAKGRGLFLVETLAAMREVWPENLPLTARFGVLEFDGRDEETSAESIALTRSFRENGLDFINVSMAFPLSPAHSMLLRGPESHALPLTWPLTQPFKPAGYP